MGARMIVLLVPILSGLVVGIYAAAEGQWVGGACAVLSGLCLAAMCIRGADVSVSIGLAACTALGVMSVMFERGHFDIDSNVAFSDVGIAALTMDIHGHQCPGLGHSVRDRAALSCTVAPYQNTAVGVQALFQAQYMGAAYGLAQSVRDISAAPEFECMDALRDLIAACPTFVRQLSPDTRTNLAL